VSVAERRGRAWSQAPPGDMSYQSYMMPAIYSQVSKSNKLAHTYVRSRQVQNGHCVSSDPSNSQAASTGPGHLPASGNGELRPVLHAPPQSLRISPWARSQIHAVIAQADSRCTGTPATRPPNHGAPTRPADRRPPMDKGGQHSSAAALLQLVEAGADELVPADSSRA